MYQLRWIVCKLLANFKKAKGRKTCDLCNRLIIKVPRTGIEPALPCDNQILSLARLPIPPSGLFSLMHECNLLRQGINRDLCHNFRFQRAAILRQHYNSAKIRSKYFF